MLKIIFKFDIQLKIDKKIVGEFYLLNLGAPGKTENSAQYDEISFQPSKQKSTKNNL